MSGELIGAVLVFAGLLLTQYLLQKRWTHEQDEKREELAARLAQDRREEHEALLSRMAEQNAAVVNNALRVAEVHQEDADKARELHAECRQEVAVLAGKVDEMRSRITENERLMG